MTVQIIFNLQNHSTFYSEERLINLVRGREGFVGLSILSVYGSVVVQCEGGINIWKCCESPFANLNNYQWKDFKNFVAIPCWRYLGPYIKLNPCPRSQGWFPPEADWRANWSKLQDPVACSVSPFAGLNLLGVYWSKTGN